MDFDALFGAAMSPIYAVHGKVATWQGAYCMVIIDLPDVPVDFGRSRVSMTSRVLKVRAPEVPNPTAGDLVIIMPGTDQEASYRIIGTPEADALRSEWTAEATAA